MKKNVENKIKKIVNKKQINNSKLTERILKIIKNTNDTLYQPGIYDVTDSDYGGMRDEVIFTFVLTKPMNLKDMVIELYDKKGYLSPWNYLTIRKHQSDTYGMLKI